jgi:hypothetical protein
MEFGPPPDLTWYKLLTDWGSFVGGFFALIAGAVAYLAGWLQARATQTAARMQVEADQRKEERELESLRKSLAIEVRKLVGRALVAHDLLKTLSEGDGPITAWMVESYARIPAAVVYPGSASKIGLLGSEEAMDVVVMYNLLDIAQDSAAQLMRYRTPDDISADIVASLASAFLKACTYAEMVLPKLKTGVPRHDNIDANLLSEIKKRQPPKKFERRAPSA